MEELGFIIASNGQEFKFGKYKPYNLRDHDNPSDYHKTSFVSEVLNTKEWQNLNLPIASDVDIDIGQNIALLASLGLIIGLNKTEGAFFPSTPTIVFASPIELSTMQLDILMKEKSKLLAFDGDISYVRIIDKDQNIVDRLSHMSDYYKNYVYPQILDETIKRC